MNTLKCLLNLVILLFMQSRDVDAKIRVVKYVHQKDMSEHCRRRVMPSVFLGRNVVEANSQILHFSQLEVPYSCFISIRTETGVNMVLVVQTESPPSSFCTKDKVVESPVKMFAMGETFGGYWGPVPDAILSTGTPSVEKFYTMRTTKESVYPKSDDDGEEDSNSSKEETSEEEGELGNENNTSQKPPRTTEDPNEYIREMVPIVNITGRLVKSDTEPVRAFAADDTFDLFYNVQREPGQKYQSTVLPLMQFSIGTQLSGRRGMGDTNSTQEPRFDFEYDFGSFTLDPRLMFHLSDNKSNAAGKKYRPYMNRRLDFKKMKGKHFLAQATTKHREHHVKKNKTNDSWTYIEGLLANLSTINSEQTAKEKEQESKRFSDLLRRVADWQHNYSAYLAPNMSLKNPLFLKQNLRSGSSKPVTQTAFSENNNMFNTQADLASKDMSSAEKTTRSTEDSRDTRKRSTSNAEESSETGITNIITKQVTEAVINTINQVTDLATAVTKSIKELGYNISDVTNTSEASNNETTEASTEAGLTIKSSILTEKTLSGTIADHASWENVVQVAPKIADILTTTKSTENRKRSRSNKRRRRRRHRRRRSIQAIPIEPARPHNLTTDPDVITTPESMYNFEDLQDFAMLVELSDDEIQGHLALRYMRRYVGPTLFDVCSGPDHMTQHVLFFNTSRIVLALTNFTLKRMTVIATPARWLTLSGQRCNQNSLECQVAGKRCCVNKLIACDGVPNCGALDIYDEDRLLCGADNNLQHNVYLAALTFLAVLLTLLYTVHYWLKRCVPKVSEAFFIYTDGTENILYLDSIMRSPLDHNGGYSGKIHIPKIFEDILMTDENAEPPKKSIFKRIMQCCSKKKKKYDDFALEDLDIMDGYPAEDHTFSFAEIEISKLSDRSGIEVAVQTGASLEMPTSNDVIFTPYLNLRHESIDPRAGFRDIRLQYENNDEEESDRRTSVDSELNMLKFLRQAKNAAEQCNKYQREPTLHKEDSLKETELKSMVYDRSLQAVHSNFSSESETIYRPELYKDKSAEMPFITEDPEPGPSSAPYENVKRIRFNETLTTVGPEEDDIIVSGQASTEMEPAAPTSSTRDFRRFWTSKKGKKEQKQKQKSHLQIH